MPLNRIDQLYDRLLEGSGRTRRESQIALSHALYGAFLQNRPAVIEAPTGTGKTLGYLIGALAAQEQIRVDGKPLPIVVSTATIALQEQVIDHDIPELEKVGLVDPQRVVIAKGRSRYVCLASLQREAGEKIVKIVQEPGLFEWKTDDALGSQDTARHQARVLLNQWRGGWNGERDALGGRVPEVWDRVAVDRDTCLGPRCWAYHQGCAFMEARAKMAQAQIVVANHSLVMQDRALRSERNLSLFPFEEYILIMDEAHHAPDRLMSAAETRTDLNEVEDTLPILEGVLDTINSLPRFIREALQRQDYDQSGRGGVVLTHLNRLRGALDEANIEERGWSFPSEIPPRFFEYIREARKRAWSIVGLLTSVAKDLNPYASEDAAIPGLLPQISKVSNTLRRFAVALDRFAKEETPVRWVENLGLEKGYRISTSPMDSRGLFKALFWDAGQRRTAFVSATLRPMKDFAESVDLPDDGIVDVLPYSLPYGDSRLVFPGLVHSPQDPGYAQELAQWVNKALSGRQAVLVLFNSRKMMREVYESLRDDLREITLCQGMDNSRALVARHKRRVDAGQGSILMGLHSFSEGLDLPGKYCTRLLITRLPFQPPDGPVEQVRAATWGDEYFARIMIPEATRRLIQSTGRLVRREGDRGLIAIMDNRVYRKRYGVGMVRELPPFAR